MKNFTIALSILCLIGFQLTGQTTNQKLEKSITDSESGSYVITEIGIPAINKFLPAEESKSKDVEINWQYTDAAAIGSKVKVSSETGQTFMEWSLNDKRISLYGNSSTPIWENPVDTDWEWPIDMTASGQWF